MSEAPQRPPDPQPQQPSSSTTTLGDTLWQVHLSRQQKAAARGADDYDHEAGVGHLHPQGGVSVGDELWQVHCQRARGRLDEEQDEEQEENEETKNKRKTKPAKTTTTNTSAKTIHLRNRDVTVGGV